MSSDKPVFEVVQTDASISFVFSSTFEHIDDVCERTTAFLKDGIDGIDKQLFAINLVLREGLTNAVRHGNAGIREKVVKFALMVTKDQFIRVTIEDQGEGFDWKKQQTALPDDADDHGRGFMIMQTYFDTCAYNEKGNILYLEKKILCVDSTPG